MDLTTAAELFSRGLQRAVVPDRIRPEGEPHLGKALVAHLAALFGR